VVKLTKDATKCSRADHDRLRAVSFDDRGILQITLIACWFNYINRVADSLGVGRDWGTKDLMRQPQQSEVGVSRE
jgi:alkylhydroperoxidase family enzyme